MPDFFLSLQNNTVLVEKMLSVTPHLGIHHNITLTYKTGTICLGLDITEDTNFTLFSMKNEKNGMEIKE